MKLNQNHHDNCVLWRLPCLLPAVNQSADPRLPPFLHQPPAFREKVAEFPGLIHHQAADSVLYLPTSSHCLLSVDCITH